MSKYIHTSYTSSPVTIPASFLTSPAPDTVHPPTAQRIDFASSCLPEYRDAHALVIENALSASECRTLLALAEASAGAPAPDAEGASDIEPGSRAELWKPALINAGPGVEVLMSDYRNSDRIIWDCEEMVQRLWARCLTAEGVGQALQGVGVEGCAGSAKSVLGPTAAAKGQQWRFLKLNERMRFLRYEAGGFFRAHCDGSYVNPDNERQRTLYTLHLYLNSAGLDSHENGESSKRDQDNPKTPLKGGATTFFDPNSWGDEDSVQVRKMDIDAKMGRILIFQHRGLLHSGQEVEAGLKFTLRTDIMFERIDGIEK